MIEREVCYIAEAGLDGWAVAYYHCRQALCYHCRQTVCSKCAGSVAQLSLEWHKAAGDTLLLKIVQ